MNKNTNFFDKKQQQKCQESMYKYKVGFFTVNSPPMTRDITCSKL